MRLGHSLCETLVNGPHADERRSLICDLAGRPAVLIYASEIDPTLLTLLKKLDAVAEGGKKHKMKSSCVFLTSGEKDEGPIRVLARQEALSATVIAMTPKQRNRPYFGSWPRQRNFPHEEADVTVILLQRLLVQSSYAFRKGELRNADVDTIVKAASTLLPAAKE
jgi:hypothetical protein